MFKRVSNFIKFYNKACTKYSVHSPFVYDFIESVLEHNGVYYSYLAVEHVRNQLLNNNEIIFVNDLGAGSKVLKDKKRKVSDIARTSLQNKNISQFLFRLVNYYELNNIIELGTSFGITTSYLANARKNSGSIWTIEGSDSISKIAESVFTKQNLKNIHLIKGDFAEKLPFVFKEIRDIDFVYFDGNHLKTPTLDYFMQCKKKAHLKSIFVFDDIYWSKEMNDVWEHIKSDKAVTLTIDLYKIGIVFFHPVKVKRHFKIRNINFLLKKILGLATIFK